MWPGDTQARRSAFIEVMTLAAPAVVPLQTLPTATYDLVILARRSLTEAHIATDPAERYVAAHLCALRAAAAVVAARTGPDHRRRRFRPVRDLPDLPGHEAQRPGPLLSRQRLPPQIKHCQNPRFPAGVYHASG